MKHSNQHFEPNYSKKTLQHIEQPDDFHFHYEKQPLDQNCDMSPTSTCFSESRLTSWDSQFSQKLIQSDKHSQTITAVSFGSLEGNLVGVSVQKYLSCLSDYLKLSLNYSADHFLDFISIKQFADLDFQKQQFSHILHKYYKLGKSTDQPKQVLIPQNSSIWMFLEEVTYLNYEQINLELIWIVSQIVLFKKNNNCENHQVREFLLNLAHNEKLQYISFRFLQNRGLDNSSQNMFLVFLQKIFQIISELFMHYKLFQHDSNQEENQPEIIRNELKLFSSQRDLWDSDQEDDLMIRSCPCKKIKHFTEE